MKKLSRIARVGKIGAAKPSKAVGAVRLEGTGGGVRKLDLMPEAMRAWARRIGEKRARECWNLAQKGVQATLPELCAYAWLNRRGIAFEFQTSLMGGRQTSGGAVIDFLVMGLSSNGHYVWRIQGEYWHTMPEVELKDFVQAARLKRLKVGGIPIVEVVDLWENDVYDRHREAFEQAEAGMGLRG